MELIKDKKRIINLSVVNLWMISLIVLVLGLSLYMYSVRHQTDTPRVVISTQITPAQQIVLSAEKYAWPDGTDPEKWDYETGGFKDDAIRHLYTELGYDETDSYCDLTPCNHFVDVMVYDALGIKMEIMPIDPNDEFAELPENFKIVHEGPIGDFGLMPGDIIRYKKDKKGNWQSHHALIYCGNGMIAEAGTRTRYPVIYSEYYGNETIKWERDGVDQETIQVIRVK